jgi:hypothetical protein
VSWSCASVTAADVRRCNSARVSLCGKTTEHFDCDVRAEVITTRAIFGRRRNTKPIAIDAVASGSDGAEYIIGGHLLAARIGADPCEHQHVRICLSRLRCGLPDEVRIKWSVAFRPLRLNIDDVGVTRSVGGNPRRR